MQLFIQFSSQDKQEFKNLFNCNFKGKYKQFYRINFFYYINLNNNTIKCIIMQYNIIHNAMQQNEKKKK